MDINTYLEQSGYKPALRLQKIIAKSSAGILVLFLSVGTLLGVFLTAFFLDQPKIAYRILGATEIFFAADLVFLVFWLFIKYLASTKPVSIEEVKQAVRDRAFGKSFTYPVAALLAVSSDGKYLILSKFFLNLLHTLPFNWIIRRLHIPKKDFTDLINKYYSADQSVSLEQVLATAWSKAIGANHLRIRLSDLLPTIYELDKSFQDILFAFKIDESDLAEVAYWQRRVEKRLAEQGKFWHRHNLLNIQGIGKTWSGGYTLNLDKFAEDLTLRAKYNRIPPHLYGRKKQVELLERMLIRGGGAGNAVLVGPPGVGRHTLLRAFAERINTGQTYGSLRYMRLLQIDSSAILAGSGNLNDVVDKIKTLFGEAYQAANVILVINNVDAFFDPEPEAGRVNATEALLPFLESRLRVIGITTAAGYASTVGKNPQLEKLIAKLEINEPGREETLLILQDEVAHMERRSGLFFTHAALKELVKLATKLIQNLPNPEKSLEILEETGIYVATNTSDRTVLVSHVQRVVSERTKVPVEQVATEEKSKLLNLEGILHERIIGQNEAIAEIANAMRRARSGIRSEKRPIGSFLFLGPTGVGKTETTKALASVYFGSESRLIRFDMSEFQELHAINRFIGNADTREGGMLTEAVIANPFSLILLDEIEKAHPKIMDLFLQVFDEGRLTDALGRTVDFTNSLIIATSNAGAEMIREFVKEGKNLGETKEQLLDFLQRQGHFRPEFLNRFDGLIVFRPLTPPELTQVATLLLQELNKRLKEKDIQVKITEELATALATGGYSPEFGARPLRRFIQEHIENYIASGLLSGEITRGQTVEITPDMLGAKM